jgi:hypothetical protein
MQAYNRQEKGDGEKPLVYIDWDHSVPELFVAGDPVSAAQPGKVRVTTIRSRCQAHKDMVGAAGDLTIDAGISMRGEQALTARALMCGAMVRLSNDEVRSLARMHTHTPEPEVMGKLGTPCPKCGAAMFAGHYRSCGHNSAALTASHHAVRDAVAAWLNGTVDVVARTEVKHDPIVVDGQVHAVRADIAVDQLMDDGQMKSYVIEIKTFDPRCASWRKVTVARAEDILYNKGIRQYAADAEVRVLAVGADGTIGPKSRALLGELINLRDDKGARIERDVVPDLKVCIAAALARVDAKHYTRWADEMAHWQLKLDVAEAHIKAMCAAQAAGESHAD